MFALECPHCGKTLRIDEAFRGVQGKCKACGGVVHAPHLQPENQAGRPEQTANPQSMRSLQATHPGTSPAYLHASTDEPLTLYSRPVPAYLLNSLSKNECIVAIFKVHWCAWILFVFLLIISLPFMLLPLPLAIYEFFRVHRRGYALTSKRVIAKQGIISLNTEEMRIDRIENIRISRGIMESLLGGGSLVVTGIGGSKVVLKCICAPELAKKMIEVLTEDS